MITFKVLANMGSDSFVIYFFVYLHPEMGTPGAPLLNCSVSTKSANTAGKAGTAWAALRLCPEKTKWTLNLGEDFAVSFHFHHRPCYFFIRAIVSQTLQNWCLIYLSSQMKKHPYVQNKEHDEGTKGSREIGRQKKS